MAAKALKFHREARDKVCAGLNTLASAVKVTLGPKGRTVMLTTDCIIVEAPAGRLPHSEGPPLEP